MRRIVGLLVALALVLSLSATAFAAVTFETSGTGVQLPANKNYTQKISKKFTTDGVLSVTISGNPGYKVTVTENSTGDTIGMPGFGSTEQTFTFNLKAKTLYNIEICGYDNALWTEAEATVNYKITFDDAPPVVNEPVEMDISNVPLELGENNVTLLENTIVSLFTFSPAEPGIYTFTADGAEFGSYGFAWNLIQSSENGVLEYTATAAEQTILIGLSADTPTVNVKVEKTGDYTPPVQIEYLDYEPVNSVVTNFVAPEVMNPIDITQEQNVVLGDDGYYHLGTASGPIVYVNLNSEQFVLATLTDAGAPIHMRGIYVDENGDPHYYNFMNMLLGLYYDYSRECDYHPLNTDLMIFLKAFGTSQGWYNPNTSWFTSIMSGDFVEESAWLAACYTSPDAPEIPDPTPSNPTQPSNPATTPSTPAGQATTPATTPSTPAGQATTPATEPSAPAGQPTTPAGNPTTPVVDSTTPAGVPSTPATEPSEAPALDSSALEASLGTVYSLDLTAYTAESVQVLYDAMNQVNVILSDPNLTQAMIDEANSILLSAMQSLVQIDADEPTDAPEDETPDVEEPTDEPEDEAPNVEEPTDKPENEDTDEPEDEDTDKSEDEVTDAPEDEDTDAPEDEDTDEPADEDVDEPADKPVNPDAPAKTGDAVTVVPALVLMLIAVCGVVAITVLKKKEF